MTGKIIANAQTISNILESYITRDNQGEPAGTIGKSLNLFFEVRWIKLHVRTFLCNAEALRYICNTGNDKRKAERFF